MIERPYEKLQFYKNISAIRRSVWSVTKGFERDYRRASLEELSGDMEDCYEDSLITLDEYKSFRGLYEKTDFMIGQFIRSVMKLEEDGKWKVPNRHRDK